MQQCENGKINNDANTAFLFTGYIFDQKKAAGFIGGSPHAVSIFIGMDIDADIPGNKISVQTEEEKRTLAASLNEYGDICVVTPSLGLIRGLASGEDASFASEIILRALLWGKPVGMLLDFKTDRSKHSPLHQKVYEDLEALCEMGIHIEYIHEQGKVTPAGLSLITEENIHQALVARQTVLTLNPGGIVTPLARDTAKEKHITILNMKE